MSNVIPERPLEYFNAGYHLQEAVCEALLSSEQLSSLGIVPFAEDRRDIEFEIKNALQKQGLALVVQTPKLTQIGHDGASICWQADDLTLLITEYVPTNRASNRAQFTTGLELATFCQEYLAGPQGAVEFGKLCPKAIEQGEESGLLVTKCTFDTTIMTDFGGSFEPISGHIVISPYAHQADVEKLSGDVIELSGSISAISEISAISVLTSDISALSSDTIALSSGLSSKVDKEAGKGLVELNSDGYALNAERLVAPNGMPQVFMAMSDLSEKPYWVNTRTEDIIWAASEQHVAQALPYKHRLVASEETDIGPTFICENRCINESGNPDPLEGEFFLQFPEQEEDEMGNTLMRDFMFKYYTASGVSLSFAGRVYGDYPGSDEEGEYLVTFTQIDATPAPDTSWYCRKILLTQPT